jgi:hypothetical protein
MKTTVARGDSTIACGRAAASDIEPVAATRAAVVTTNTACVAHAPASHAARRRSDARPSVSVAMATYRRKGTATVHAGTVRPSATSNLSTATARAMQASAVVSARGPA